MPTSKTRGRKPKNVQEEQKAALVREDEKNYETLLAVLQNELEQERANSREKDKKITALEKRDHDRKQVIQQIEALIKQLTYSTGQKKRTGCSLCYNRNLPICHPSLLLWKENEDFVPDSTCTRNSARNKHAMLNRFVP